MLGFRDLGFRILGCGLGFKLWVWEFSLPCNARSPSRKPAALLCQIGLLGASMGGAVALIIGHGEDVGTALGGLAFVATISITRLRSTRTRGVLSYL